MMNFAQNARSFAQVVPFVGRPSTPAPAAPTSCDVEEGPEGAAPPGAAGQDTSRATGVPVLFLHGWGVGPHSYAAPLARLRTYGCEVMAPAQPGFGGAPALQGDECCFPGYGRWAASYLDSLGVDGPVTVVGHSFGGGVAVQLAHDHPERVAAVVMCNGVGGAAWAGPERPDTVTERPWWQWGRILGADLLAGPTVVRVLPAVLGEAVPNLVSNPLAMWRVGEFVRRARLLDEVAALAERGVPLKVVWSDRDRLVPYSGFAAVCRAAGVRGEVVPGGHSWLIADPGRFADIVLRAMVEAGTVPLSMAAAG
jgi:pimeloyl-ACP methyl ester carboxylesterase